jgi:succinate-semialdehyde dehydrogenase/glutarate-semialdehyde dehydrogenase
VSYPDALLCIDGVWRAGAEGAWQGVDNPATDRQIGRVAHAAPADLEEAVAAAARSLPVWRDLHAYDRSVLMRQAAQLLRERAPEISAIMTAEQGKPLAESRGETLAAAATIEWFAEEGRRAYGRIVPGRTPGVQQLVIKRGVGPVAAFSPWNFPINQATRKIGAALAAGCTVVIKGPEETPASCVALVKAFTDAGLPAGVLNLVFGVPAEISQFLIAHPLIRKVSFTGSTAVGKQLASLAGLHMKRATMELGGHAPAIVMDDADLEGAASILAAAKFRNAGQVCIAPTRFLLHERIYERFRSHFLERVQAIRVGDGAAEGVTMGPLANRRRLEAMDRLVVDAVQRGATLAAGGHRIGNAGNFFAPTVLEEVPLEAEAMNAEPFGPIALLSSFSRYEDAVAEANRLPYGLAAYAFTTSHRTVQALGQDIESGMISINHQGLGPPELPFGGIKDSGYGSEGGSEALEAYLDTRLVTVA